jgi:hypothetical protein
MIKQCIQAAVGWGSKSEAERYLLKYRYSSLISRAIALLPIPLWWLLQAFGSDKHTPGWHSYGRTYGELFRKWKYQRLTLLEIGIGGYQDSLGGRSLLAWQAFFPLGTIVAADIVSKQVLTGGRLTIRQVDQSSVTDLTALSRQDGPFDVIIDDGSHFNAHQILTFQTLFAGLKDGGVYVVEDVQTSFWPGTVRDTVWDGARIGEPAFPNTCYGYFLELAKYVNHAEFVDSTYVDETMLGFAKQITRIGFEHNLIILLKGDNTQRSTFVGHDRA